MEFQIKLNSLEEVAKFVNKLEYYECQADAWMGSLVVDARSLMGLVGFGIGRVIRLVIYSEYDEIIQRELCEFMAA